MLKQLVMCLFLFGVSVAFSEEGLGRGSLEQSPRAPFSRGSSSASSVSIGWGFTEWEIGDAELSSPTFVSRAQYSWFLSEAASVGLDLRYIAGDDQSGEYGDGDLTSFSLGLAGRYYITPHGNALWFLGAGIDYTYLNLTLDRTRTTTGTFTDASLDADWGFGAIVEGGVDIAVSDTLTIGLGLMYTTTVGAEVDVNGETQDAGIQTIAGMASLGWTW